MLEQAQGEEAKNDQAQDGRDVSQYMTWQQRLRARKSRLLGKPKSAEVEGTEACVV
jgi:hypothetical protein